MHPFESAGLGKGPFRFFSMERTSGRCQCCGQTIEKDGAEVDHLREEGSRLVVVLRGPERAARRLARFMRSVREVVAVERLAAVAVALVLAGTAEARTVSGLAEVIDGDTIRVAGQVVRLMGIDAPELKQPYGPQAADELNSMLERYGRRVVCEWDELDRYGRRLGTCFSGQINLNAELVEYGAAHAYARYSRRYTEHERRAIEGRLGLWGYGPGTVTRPWYWRQMEAYDQRRALEGRR